MLKTICLSMIVKNEAQVIKRCLNSVRPYIHGYEICDTGSTDGTPDIIRESLGGLPGNVTSHAWHNFSHNRNVAIELAARKSDFLLTIDADETMQGTLKDEEYDCLYTPTFDPISNERYLRPRIFRNNGAWRYINKIHEVLVPLTQQNTIVRDFPLFLSHYDSNRNKLGDKFQRDLQTLLNEPMTTRNTFYLAQTYLCLQRYEEAIPIYKLRIEKKGWEEEVYYSMFQIGKCLKALGQIEEALGQFFKAYAYRPSRYEALHEIFKILAEKNQLDFACSLLGKPFVPSKDTLFVNVNSHWRINELKAGYLASIGKKEEAKIVYEEVKAKAYNTTQDHQRLDQFIQCL